MRGRGWQRGIESERGRCPSHFPSRSAAKQRTGIGGGSCQSPFCSLISPIPVFFLPSPRPAKQLGLETSFKSIQFLSSSSGRECAAWCTRTNQRTGMRRIGPDVCVRFRNAGGAVRRYATRNGGSERAQMGRDLSVTRKGGGVCQ